MCIRDRCSQSRSPPGCDHSGSGYRICQNSRTVGSPDQRSGKTAEARLSSAFGSITEILYRTDHPGTCCFTAGLRNLRFHDSLRRERLRDHPDPQCQSGKRCFESLLQLHGNEKQREITEKTAEATHVRGGEFIAYLLRSWSSISQNPQKAREFLKNFIFFMNSPEKNTDRNPCFQDCGLFV